MVNHRVMAAFLGLALLPALAAAQQTGRITGTVTSAGTAQPVADASVSVTGTRFRAVTDAAGRYAIVDVPAGTYSVDVRRFGFERMVVPGVIVPPNGVVTADIQMKTAVLNLEAVVSTGVVDPTAGTRVPFTVGRVDAANLPVPPTNAIESIQGKIAGVTVVPTGQPGSGTNIMLRSPTSINKSNAPLIVVDGVIQSQSFNAATADLEGMDIESVEVVKGAAAASLYGSRAQSGVIQIRTRRGGEGVEGATRFAFRSELGTNQLGGKIDWAQHHYYQTNDAGEYVNALGAVVPRAQRVARPAWQRFQDVPYRDPVYDQVDRFFDPGQFSKNSVNLSQNFTKTNWYFSAVESREDGVVLESGRYLQRDMRINLDHRPIDKLSVSLSGYHSLSNRRELYGDTFFDLINQAPDVDLRVPDPDGTPYLFQGDPEGREENPLYVLATEDSRRRRSRTQGNLAARFAPLGWLTFDGDISYDRSDRRNDFFLDQGKKTEGFALGGLGEISQTTGTTTAVNSAGSANLLGSVGDFTLRSTLRAMMERERNDVTTANGQDFAVPGVPSLNNTRTRFVSSSTEEVRSTAYFVTGGADYRGRYIVDALHRWDGSSLFGPNERWNTYYRLSGAWRLSHESWWQWPSLNEFKLRASRGTAGGRPSFNDQYETFVFNSAGGVTKQNLGNVNLKPEHATETEVGVDMIFRQRYSLQLSRAQTKVVDQLIQVPLAGFYGYGSQWQNAGTIEGNTLEATLEAQLIQRPDRAWRLGFVADRSRHEVTEFNRPCFSTNTIAYRCAGVSLGAMYGFSFLKNAAGLPADVGARANEFVVNDEGLLVWVGLDASGNPKKYSDGAVATGGWGTSATIGTSTYGWGMPITQKDPATGSAALVNIGDGNPDYRWGMTNNVTWKSFDFYALVDVQAGGQNYNQTNQRMYQWGRSADVDQVGKAEGEKKPVEYYIALYAANDPTDYFVEDAGYMKLRELSVRHRLTGRSLNLLRGIGARGVSLSLIGRNLWTSTNYKGYDPEVGGTIVRLDSFDYPRYRTFTGSIQIEF
ncbi:MAG TPA: SusC/RagA family TonB-linked outer membrane protein [Gemmatimonadaceae bacterium]|nr:SusC/RagA family TonB-linked outer membrane protein [Gemmatimonadaceae bacterium]